MVATNRKDDMKDPADNKTQDLIEPPKTKAQRFREKQVAAGLRQFAYWLTESEAQAVRDYIDKLRGGK